MSQAGGPAEVVVYSRPRCGFCMRLRWGLNRKNVPYREVDIWQDRKAAATVRAVANGNETVPTVAVGDRWLVNPSVREVINALHDASH